MACEEFTDGEGGQKEGGRNVQAWTLMAGMEEGQV